MPPKEPQPQHDPLRPKHCPESPHEGCGEESPLEEEQHPEEGEQRGVRLCVGDCVERGRRGGQEVEEGGEEREGAVVGDCEREPGGMSR